jgi:hypothetical protein
VRPLIALLTAFLAVAPAAAQCDEKTMSCPRRDAPRTENWGQGDPGTIHAIFEKVANGAKREKFAKENQGWFSKVIGRDPSIEAKVVIDDKYLPEDSPLVASKNEGGDPVVKVGKAALDLAQSEGEMAYLMGHELHHTIVQQRKRDCLRRGVAKMGNPTMLKYSKEMKAYQRELEREADAWGQRYAANASYNPLAAVEATRHVNDLGEALGADASADTDHDSFSEREQQLKSYGSGPLFEAKCPWPEE